MKTYLDWRSCALTFLVLGIGASNALAATNFLVTIRDWNFRPTNLVINVGDTVTWSNMVSTMHDVTEGLTNKPPPLPRLFFSGELALSGKFSFTFSNAGTIQYFCSNHIYGVGTAYHPEQTGTVTVTTANLPPTVNLTNPVNNAIFNLPTNITVSADAADTNGAVTSVKFFLDGVLVATDTISPYNTVLTNPPVGAHTLRGVVTDNLGLSTTSATVNVTFNAPQTTNTIQVADFSYTPSNLTVTAGSSVIWNRNGGVASHTVTGSGGSFEPLCGPAVFIAAGRSCTNRFMAPGSYNFFCSVHPTLMVGTINVLPTTNTPSVAIARPSAGAVFLTNSLVVLEAAAGGVRPISNVEFFTPPNVSLGQDAASPYNGSFLAAQGSYAVFARAVDNQGFAAFTPSVSFSAVAPVPLQILSQTIIDGSMKFELTTTPGLTYVVEKSARIPPTFQPFGTNVAAGSMTSFNDPAPATQTQQVYRAFIQP